MSIENPKNPLYIRSDKDGNPASFWDKYRSNIREEFVECAKCGFWFRLGTYEDIPKQCTNCGNC